MAAHRYWRAVGLEAYGTGDLELSEFHLLAAGVRVDAPATLTSNIAPDVSGELANLQDDVLTTAARWSANAVKTLVLSWDFGVSPVAVDDIRLAGDSEVRFLLIVKVQWSDDAVAWNYLATAAGVKWPGTGITTQSAEGVMGANLPSNSILSALLHFNGADLSTVFIDASGKTVSAVGAAKISTVNSLFGGSSLLLNGINSGVGYSAHSDFGFGTGDFTIEMAVHLNANLGAGAYWNLCDFRNTATAVPWTFFLKNSGANNFLGFYNGASSSTVNMTNIPSGVMTRVSISRKSGVAYLCINGILQTTYLEGNAAFTTDLGASQPLKIGCDADNTSSFNGYVDEFRCVKGSALRISSYTLDSVEFVRAGGISLNTVMGRSAPSGTFILGTTPAIIYGIPQITPPIYLGVETGSVKDYTTGVLGQGIGRVRGTVKVTPSTPVFRKVRLIREKDGLVIREKWSDPITGAYDFQYVDEVQTYTVISFDHQHNYRAVLADNLTLANAGVELMP
jgi:hypothetical protein